MSAFLHHFSLALPLFVLALVGYAFGRWGGWAGQRAGVLTDFVFRLALPAMLFHMMSDFSKLPPVDARLLIAFFGSCLIVFVAGRLFCAWYFKLDGTAQSIFGLAGVFSNNVLLGIPIARATLGDAAIPSVALVLVFNALILWTLATVSVEWSRHGAFSLRTLWKTVRAVLTNPVVAAILSGSLLGITGIRLPELIDVPLSMVGQIAAPLALLVLGMGLAEYGWRADLRQSLTMTAFKLIVQPLVVWAIAWMLDLPPMETRAVVLLGSVATGVNVYIMSRQFGALEGPVAATLILTTAGAAITTPLFLTLTA
jgi:predicted permease